MNNSEERGQCQWVDGRERSRVKDNELRHIVVRGGGGRMLVRRWSKPFHRASVAAYQLQVVQVQQTLVAFSLKNWSCLSCGRAGRMVAGRLFHKVIMQSG